MARSSPLTAVTKAGRPMHFSRKNPGRSFTERLPCSLMALLASFMAERVSTYSAFQQRFLCLHLTQT